MRLKKGFTLAEILIVLMVIGAIATMTIPSLMRGVTDTQFKTAYKKAFNNIVNMSSMERVSGNLPSAGSTAAMTSFFETMVSYLSVKEYASAPTASLTTTSTPASFANGVQYKTGAGTEADPTVTHTIGVATGALDFAPEGATASPWIITEDNIAYSLVQGTGTSGACGSKAEINQATQGQEMAQACLAVVVDVNGVIKGPNLMTTEASGGITADTALPDLSAGDRYYVYLGTDGATAGSRTTTVTGRIVADAK